jgi:pimeloyl-ACP methyl ester carboxylesterase
MSSRPKRSLRRRVIFTMVTGIIAVAIAAAAVPMALGMAFLRYITSGACGGSISPDTYDLPFEEVAIHLSAIDRAVPGYFIPGGNGVTLIVPPTGNAGNGNLMHEIAVLNRHGYSVLVFASRACAGYSTHSLGYVEADDIRDALDYLATRADVDMDRVGIHGFSTAGATAIFAAARYPELRAVVAKGNYHDFLAHMENSVTGWYGGFYLFGAKLYYRLATGYDLSVLSPVSVIGQIAPRPLLLIYGTGEPARYGGRLELAAAGTNAELWEVEGAGHGNYQYVAPEAFEERVIGFYNRAFGIGT